MNSRYRNRANRLVVWLTLTAILAMPLGVVSQTQIKVPSNRYRIEDDVQLGQEAAQQVRQQMPLLNDRYVDDYIERVGERLVAAIPPELRHPQFRYTF